MKKINQICVVMMLFVTVLISCTDDDQQIISKTEVDSRKQAGNALYRATWSEWGRAARDCDGAGLCNYTDCWNCSEEDLNKSGNMYGTIIRYNKSTTAVMTIELSPESIAKMDQGEIFKSIFIDEDLSGEKYTLLSGEYDFIPTLGDYGGYEINVEFLD